MILRKLKSKLGLCDYKGCLRKAVYNFRIPRVDHKGQLCEEHMQQLEEKSIFLIIREFKI